MHADVDPEADLEREREARAHGAAVVVRLLGDEVEREGDAGEVEGGRGEVGEEWCYFHGDEEIELRNVFCCRRSPGLGLARDQVNRVVVGEAKGVVGSWLLLVRKALKDGYSDALDGSYKLSS